MIKPWANLLGECANKISLSHFFPINLLRNNADEHNESVVPIKSIDGQLGSGRLIDFALTSGRPAGPWHAYRLMSPFTCKCKEIMRASPRKFTHKKRRRHPQYGGGSLRRDGRSSKSPCTFLLGATRPEDFGFTSVIGLGSLGVHSLWPLNRRMA